MLAASTKGKASSSDQIRYTSEACLDLIRLTRSYWKDPVIAGRALTYDPQGGRSARIVFIHLPPG